MRTNNNKSGSCALGVFASGFLGEDRYSLPSIAAACRMTGAGNTKFRAAVSADVALTQSLAGWSITTIRVRVRKLRLKKSIF